MRCLALILIALPTTLTAQRTARLEGKVVDASTREPIVGATVWLQGTRFGTASDSTGAYWISRPPVGTFDVQVSSVGYATTLLPRLSIESNETTRLDVGLIEIAISGECEFVISEDCERQPVTTVTVTGTIVDILTGEPVAGASITFGDLIASSDSDGHYVMQDLATDECSVIAAADGFHPVIYRRLDFFRDQELNFLLSRSASGDSVETAR